MRVKSHQFIGQIKNGFKLAKRKAAFTGQKLDLNLQEENRDSIIGKPPQVKKTSYYTQSD